MRKYRATRLKQLIFPQELIIDKYHVLSRKRHFPAFWSVREESIPLSKLASIQIHRGLFFSKLIIENSGGPYPIIVDGLWNGAAKEARDLLEMIEREMQKREDISSLVGDDDSDEDSNPPGGRGPGPRESHNPGPPSDSENRYVSPIVETRLSDSTDNSHLEASTREILNDDWEQPDTPPKSPVALYPRSTRSQRVPDDRPLLPSEEILMSEMQSESKKHVGEIPENWKPAPPWSLAEKKPEKPIGPGFPEVDPVEFLNRDPEPSVTVNVEDQKARKQSSAENLANWWSKTKEETGGNPPRIRRKKRKLK